jgi:hypothetical protein
VNDPTNDELFAELREAMLTAAEVPERFLAAGRAAFAWRTADAELAALTQDTAIDQALSGTRAEPSAHRALTFTAGDQSIEVELSQDALQGQVVPPQPGEVELRTPDGAARTAAVDNQGWFTIGPVPTTMFRLHLRPANGDTLITEWITPAPDDRAG